jgi:hypothetical protein
MKIKSTNNNTILEIPIVHEEVVKEFLELTKVFKHVQSMLFDELIDYTTYKNIDDRFTTQENYLGRLLANELKDIQLLYISEYYWELYED